MGIIKSKRGSAVNANCFVLLKLNQMSEEKQQQKKTLKKTDTVSHDLCTSRVFFIFLPSYRLHLCSESSLSPALPVASPLPPRFAFSSFIFNELFQVQTREEQIKGTFSTGREEVTIEPINQSNENRSSNLNALHRTFVFFS